MTVYDKFVELAFKLIAKFGEDSFLIRRIEGVPGDNEKPWRPGAASETVYAVKAAWLDEQTATKAGFLIKTGQALVLIPAKGLVIDPDPATDTFVRASGSKHAVNVSKPLEPSGQRIIFQVNVVS